MRFFRWLYNQYIRSTQIRLTSSFLLVLLPLVFVSLYANDRSRQIVLDQTLSQAQNNLDSQAAHMDLTLKNVEELSRMIALDKTLLQMLDQAGPELTPQSIIQFTEILNRLWHVTSISQILSEISVYHAKSGTVVSTKNGAKRITLADQKEVYEQLALSSGIGGTYVLPSQKIMKDTTFRELSGSEMVSLVRTMDLSAWSKHSNLFIVTLNKKKLNELILSALPSAGTHLYLFEKDGNIITGSDQPDSGTGFINVKKEGMLRIQAELPSYKWSLVMLQPEQEIYGQTGVVRTYTYLIIVISVLLSLILSWWVFIRIASPLDRLSYGMKELSSGNYDLRLDTTRKDEFGYLMKTYNKMARHQKHLIEDYYEQQLRLANTELKFLQSQINPHFLYNTLDSIYWMAKNYEAEEISEMVLNLSRFFRLSLNKGKEAFTVEETISHLHYYIRVQQIRFLDSFTVSYQIQEESKTIPVYKLLLQPLVENALLHGLERKQEGGELIISSYLEEEYLVLSVQDNGDGINRERLDYIQQELGSLAQNKAAILHDMERTIQDLYGLRNVLIRLKMMYGPKADLQLESEEGVETRITLFIPLDSCKSEFIMDGKERLA